MSLFFANAAEMRFKKTIAGSLYEKRPIKKRESFNPPILALGGSILGWGGEVVALGG